MPGTHELLWPELAEWMTPERAAFIRAFRVERDATWRAVADECHRRFGGVWEPTWNQLAGMDLCHLAAAHHGEDYMAPPWN